MTTPSTSKMTFKIYFLTFFLFDCSKTLSNYQNFLKSRRRPFEQSLFLFISQDVAYALTTSLECELLPEMDSSVDFYLEELQRQLESRGKLYHANVKDLRSHFDLVWLDYARVIVTGLWKRLSKEQMERYRDVVGPSMINKSLPHIQFIIERIHQKLVEEDVCSVLEEAK